MAEREGILDHELAARSERARAALWQRLEGPIELPAHSWMDPAWMRAAFSDGVCGPAIAFAHRALATGDERHADRSRALLVEAVEVGRALWIAPGLIQGIAGLGYTLEHFVAVGLVDGVEEVADTIAGRACEAMAPGGLTFDHFFGTAGMVVYGTERARGSHATDVRDEALARLIAAAAGGTWRKRADTRWMDPADVARYPDGLFDTSMSHGVAGALAGLAVALREHAGAAELARATLAWLWGIPSDDDRRWPTVIGERGGGAGWCRGDLGIATAALAAARALADADWIERATAAARAALARRDWKSEAIALCHGPAGAAHIAHRLYGLTGEPAFADAARRACNDLLDHLDVAVLDPGLLNGAAGVALALHSLLEPHGEMPPWDGWYLPGLDTLVSDKSRTG